jgi:outer membrane protein assembly complex protein YaeT
MAHTAATDRPRRRIVVIRTNARWISLVLALCAAAAVLAAQEPSPEGKAITALRVEQEGREVTDPDVLALIETKIGRPFSMVDARESRTHLDSLARYEDIVVRTVDTPGGVEVVFELKPLRPIDRIEFRGNLRLSKNTLDASVRQGLGSSLLASRLDVAEGLLRERYRDKGYATPAIKHELVPRTRPNRSTLLFTIDAGRRSIVKDVRVNPLDKALIRLPDVRKGQLYDAERVRATLDKYLDGMRKDGFYEASADPVADFQPDGVVLQIDVQRGRHVRLVFTGDPLKRSDQEKLVPLRTEGTVNEDLLENATSDIEQFLRRQGYRDARAPHTRVESEEELTITFDVMRGPRYVIADVRLTGQQKLTERNLRNVPTPNGNVDLLAGLKKGKPFIEGVAENTRAAVQTLYLNKGYVRAMVTASYPVMTPETADMPRKVHVTFNVSEGGEAKVRSIAFAGNEKVPNDDLLKVLETNGIKVNEPLSVDKLAAGLLAIDNLYKDRGFESVQRSQPTISLTPEGDEADMAINIVEGTQTFVDRVIIEGNERTSRATIERELQLHAGDPLGATKRLESEAKLRDLGLFRRVRIDERRHPGEDERVDLIVRLEEALRTTLGYGGGLEVSSRLRPTGLNGAAEERLDFVPRAFFEIGRRNMWGKNRSVNLFTRISGKSEDTVIAPASPDAPALVNSSYGVNEYRVLATFREPRVFGTPAQALFTGIAERAIRTSYSFVTREVRAEVGGNLKEHYNASVRFSVKKADVFDIDPNLPADQRPLIDRLFPKVRLSKIALSLIRNTRTPNDLDPSSGTFLTADPEVAAKLLGSEVGYVKGLMQLSWYHQLPVERRTILALRGVLGAAKGFAQLTPVDANGNPIPQPLDANGNPIPQPDLPASERFFAGGSTTNRGFSVDMLGPLTVDGFPSGGDAEILLNSEVRMSLFKSFSGVAFFDAGNVFTSASDMSLAALRPAVGGGVHVISPFGPIRFEVGFNLDRREITPGNLERGYVFHVSLGPAF